MEYLCYRIKYLATMVLKMSDHELSWNTSARILHTEVL